MLKQRSQGMSGLPVSCDLYVGMNFSCKYADNYIEISVLAGCTKTAEFDGCVCWQ